MRVLPILLLLALLPLAPSGQAHISGFSQGKSLNVGPYLAYVATQGSGGSPEDIFADSPLTFTAQLARASDGSLVTTLPGTISIAAVSSNWNKTLQMQSDGTGFLVASAILPAAGNYSVTFQTKDQAGSYQNGSTIQAYPNLPFRMRAVDPAQDIIVGATTTLALESDDPTDLRAADKFSDLQVDVERWSDDHTIMYGATTVNARHAGPGLWKIDYVFPQPSMYHLRFASRAGGFNMTDVPIMHLYATQSPAAQKTPAPGLVGLGASVLVAFALARRARD